MRSSGFLLGWGPVGAVALAGVTWVSSSGVVAKVLQDLGRLTNRETPVVLSVLVIEDLAMAFYLPVLTALLIGGGTRVPESSASPSRSPRCSFILYIALRHGTDGLQTRVVQERRGPAAVRYSD